MNLKNVLKTYSLLRSLSDDESALLNTLRSLNDSEREQLVETMAPVKATTKKPRKKRAAKSQHAQSLFSAIQRVPKGKVDTPDDDEDGPRCTYIMGDNEPCNSTEHSPIHKQDGGYLRWHEFQPEKSIARPARGRSSANGAGTNTTQNSETEVEDVSNAVHAGG